MAASIALLRYYKKHMLAIETFNFSFGTGRPRLGSVLTRRLQ